MQNFREIRDITKEYKTMFKIITYKTPFNIPVDTFKIPTEEKKETQKTEDNITRSIRRTRSTINDYILNNSFDLFVTFTLDPKKIDRYNSDICFIKMQNYLAVQRRKAKEQQTQFNYIVVPEKHKDGAIHFHALIGNLPSPLKKTKVIKNSKRVYNIPSFKYGNTLAQYLDNDLQKTTAYICKYITKDMQLIHNKRRYWQSRNLQKPLHHVNKLWQFNLSPYINQKSLQYENENYTIHHVHRHIPQG